MAIYRRASDGALHSADQIIAANPNSSAAVKPMTVEKLAALGYDPILEGSKPTPANRHEFVRKVAEPVEDAYGNWVWAYEAVDKRAGMDEGELAAYLEADRAVKRAGINAERDRRVYTPIDSVDIKGDGSVMVEPDIRNARDEANLIALSLRATQLAAAGVTDPVFPFGAADNVEYILTPSEMIAVAAAPFTRASVLFERARDLKGELPAADDCDDLDLIDIESGSINGSGSWPS